MANTTDSPRGRSRRRSCGGAVTRVKLVTVFLAATLCSASYCLGVWHNSRGAADSRVLGPSAALVAAAACGGDDDPLDFETHHSAEAAGLSVSSSSSMMVSPSTRRALRGGAVPGDTGYGGSSAFTRWMTSGDRWWAGLVGGGWLRFTDAGGAVRA